MTGPYTPPSSRRSRGFSLIELMVSLTIGLVISIAAVAAYIGASNAGRMSDVQGRMNEDAQSALKILSQQIRLAGTNPAQPNRGTWAHNPMFSVLYIGGSTASVAAATGYSGGFTQRQFGLRGCDGTFTNASAATTTDALTCAGTATSNPDSISVSYEADQYDTIQQTAGVATDCQGNNALPTYTLTLQGEAAPTPQVAMADNHFYISGTVPSLYCLGTGSGTTPQPMVENVEDMQFKYGTVASTNTATTASVAGYLDASSANLEASGTSVAQAASNWGRVLTVRVCVLIRSENPVDATLASSGYYPCNSTTLNTTNPDNRLRHAYYTTVVLRNRRY